MLPRRGSLTVVITVGAWASACTAAGTPMPPAGSSAGCAPAGARLLATSPRASVFASGGVVYGCANAGTTRHRLGTASFCVGTHAVGPATVAGELAAYGLTSCGVDAGSGQLIVRRLTDGKQLFAGPATTHPLGPESYNRVVAVVLENDGAVAWIGEANSIIHQQGRDVEVRRATKAGQTLLDSGDTIKTGSLKLHGSKLTWQHGRTTRSATLH